MGHSSLGAHIALNRFGYGLKLGERAPADPETYLLRGYDANDRIVGGTGGVIEQDQMEPHATDLLHDDRVAYIHVRSSSNNCYLARIDRQGGSDDSTT